MRFSITIKGIKKDVDVEPIDDKKLRVRVDGVDYEVSVEGLEALATMTKKTPTLYYELEQDLSVVESEPREERVLQPAVELKTVRPEVKEGAPPIKEFSVKEARPKPEKGGSFEVKSPLPGVISMVEVKEGGTVKRGDVLLYIESMKMLNEVVAPRDGIVRRVLKGAGEQVNVGDPLLELIPAGE